MIKPHYRFDNFHPEVTPRPRHLGLIPDGMRRWAVRKKVSLLDSYYVAGKKAFEHVSFCFGAGISEVTLSVWNTHNFRRSTADVTSALQGIENFFLVYAPIVIAHFGAAVQVAGNIDLLPPKLRAVISNLPNPRHVRCCRTLYLCIAYNPLDEIAQACKGKGFSKECLSNLWIPHPVDLVIRTGKVMLLSNFPPLQAGFARLYRINKLFNDVTSSDLQRVLRHFERAKRKYGH